MRRHVSPSILMQRYCVKLVNVNVNYFSLPSGVNVSLSDRSYHYLVYYFQMCFQCLSLRGEGWSFERLKGCKISE